MYSWYMNSLLRALTFALMAIVFLSAASAYGCIWSYGTDLRGRKVQVEGLQGVDLEAALLGDKSGTDWAEQRRLYAIRVAKSSDYQVRNDYAVTLLHVGETSEAIKILRQLEREKPGKYVTAVNLGTALELAGHDAEALRWIREGIRRNSDAHDGTEWLHARILETKLALARDSHWLEKTSVLGLDFGKAVVPTMPRSWPSDNRGLPVTAKAAQNALYYQLHERLQFIEPPDRVIASLLSDGGNLAMLTGTLETAETLYKQSLRFGASQPAQSRLTYTQQLLRKHRSYRK